MLLKESLRSNSEVCVTLKQELRARKPFSVIDYDNNYAAAFESWDRANSHIRFLREKGLGDEFAILERMLLD